VSNFLPVAFYPTKAGLVAGSAGREKLSLLLSCKTDTAPESTVASSTLSGEQHSEQPMRGDQPAKFLSQIGIDPERLVDAANTFQLKVSLDLIHILKFA
jgi:hypothetical protein